MKPVLLLGCGYSLSHFALGRPSGSVLATRSNDAVFPWFASRGICAIRYNDDEPSDNERLYATVREMCIETVIDSIPPRTADAAARTLQRAAALASAGVKRALYLSTTGVFGRRDGSLVDEATVPAPQSEPALLRLAVEEAYRASSLETSALRLPAIYGPGRGIGLMLRAGTYRLIGDGGDYTNRIHVTDIALLLTALLDAPKLPAVIAVGDGNPALSRDVVSYYCEKFSLPYPGTISKEQALQSGHHTRLSNQRIDNRLMQRIVGKPLNFPSFREGAGQEFLPDPTA